MNCRPGCGACCIAPAISSPIPGMPQGKPAGVPCIHLDEMRRCRIFAHPERPQVCARFVPDPEHCGRDADEALRILTALEQETGADSGC